MAEYRGQFFVWRRVAQGCVNGPQAWGRISALVSRLVQSMSSDGELELQTYTDDPIATTCADEATTKSYHCIIILIWRALGFKLAFHKAQRGHAVGWIGHDLRFANDVLFATISADFMAKLRETTATLSSSNVISIDDIRSFAGCCNHVSRRLWTWRPFLDELWGCDLFDRRVERTPELRMARSS